MPQNPAQMLELEEPDRPQASTQDQPGESGESGESGETEETELQGAWILFRDLETAELHSFPFPCEEGFEQNPQKLVEMVQEIAMIRSQIANPASTEFAGILQAANGEPILTPAGLGRILCAWLSEAGRNS